MGISILLWMSSVTVLLHKAQPSNITVYLSQEVARVGDNVTLTCLLSGLDSGTAVTIHKGVSPTNGTYIEEDVSINDDLVNPYKKFNRFSVVRSTEGSDVKFTLRITGVQLEDSGGYACKISKDDHFVGKILEVYRKPTNITFSLDNQFVANNSVMTVREVHNPIDIVCRVSEVMPQPFVEILLDREATASRNITDDFAIVAQKNIKCPGLDSSKTCPIHLSYTTEAANRRFNVSFVHDSKKLTCISKMNAKSLMQEPDTEQIVTEVTLRVLYLPKILCAGLWNTTLNATNLEIRCRVNAYPVSSSSNKSVTIDQKKGAMLLVKPGDDSEFYSLQDKVEMNTEEKISTMIFTVKTVTEEHFNFTYTFYAGNSEGATEKRIRIEKTMTPIIVDGAEAIMKRGVILPVVLLALFAVLF